MLKICLTGGPCGGKSTAMSRLSRALEDRGYKVFIIPETATELILNGIRPGENISMSAFQEFVIDKQISKENLYNRLRAYYPNEKIVIICDRGLFDNCAYITKDEFREKMDLRGLSFSDINARYDAVLHLVTAADGAEEFYQWNDPNSDSTGNNAARFDSPEEARIKDKQTMNCWVGHPHLRVFDNSVDFGTKIQNVLDEIFALLGEPTPSEIERKFLIRKPTKEQLEKLGCVSRSNIIQTYLVSNKPGVERRVRQRGTPAEGYSFYYTEKSEIAPGVRSEKESKISANEYVAYLSEADIAMHQIRKNRHCFVFARQYFELDIYPFDDEYAILEIELNDINDNVELPDLDVIKEVTDDVRFRNSSLAKTLSFNIDKESIETEWIYETGRQEPEILGSGSTYHHVEKTRDEKLAYELAHEMGRNYLIREKEVDGKKVSQWYNQFTKNWQDEM